MLNKKILIPLIAVVVLGLALVLVLVTGEDKAPQTAPSDGDSYQSYQTERIFDFGMDSVTYIKIKLNSETFAFEKQDDMWYVEGNHNISVSSSAVDSLAGLVVSISYSDSITDGSVTREDCGITADANSVTFISSLGEVVIYKGITTPDKLSTYVMTNQSDTVYLADTNFVENLFAPLNNYRHSATINLDFDSITDITVKNDNTIVLKKGEANADSAVFNEWKMLSPISVEARDEQIKALIIEPLKSIRITDYVSDMGDFEKYGLKNKDRYVKLTDSYGKTQTLYFSAQTDGVYYISVNNNKTIYSISYSAAPYVALETSEIFYRNINLVKMADISTVTLKGDGYDYEIEFKKDGGKINGTDVSFDVMNQTVFASVCGIFADDILLESYGSTKVTLTFNYTNSKSDVLTFADYDERYYSVAKNGKVMYKILKAKISELASALEECK